MPVDFSRNRSVREITADVTYDMTEATELFTLPRGARVIAWLWNTQVEFDGTGGGIDIGILSDADYFVSGDVPWTVRAWASSAGVTENPGVELSRARGVYATVTRPGATAGSTALTVTFSMEEGTPI